MMKASLAPVLLLLAPVLLLVGIAPVEVYGGSTLRKLTPKKGSKKAKKSSKSEASVCPNDPIAGDNCLDDGIPNRDPCDGGDCCVRGQCNCFCRDSGSTLR